MSNLEYPVVKAVGSQNKRTVWELENDFALKVPMGHFGDFLFQLPKGTRTDFASVPKFFWFFMAPTDIDVLVPALIHDDLYNFESKMSRFMADSWFRHILKLYGCPLWKRLAAYYAVRAFGWSSWK